MILLIQNKAVFLSDKEYSYSVYYRNTIYKGHDFLWFSMLPSSGLLHNGIHNYEMTVQITPFAPSSREYWVLNIACSLVSITTQSPITVH